MARDGRTSRWDVRRREFRQHGLPHQLLVLTDVSHVLREEERLAWQRIVRVLSHEINNSLAPIKSIARSLQRVIRREPRALGWEPEVLHGLDVIEGRSGSLSRFLQAYARLARLPKPVRRPVDVGEWVKRVVDLEERMRDAVPRAPNDGRRRSRPARPTPHQYRAQRGRRGRGHRRWRSRLVDVGRLGTRRRRRG